MNRLGVILKDGVILFAVSTVLVVCVDQGFSLLKGKSAKDDPLVTAIVQGKTEELENLAEGGAGVTGRKDDQGRTALMRAAYVNLDGAELLATADIERAEMVVLLVGRGAPVNAVDNDGWSALMWASWSGLNEVASRLLESGANPTLADRQGNTALTIAAGRGNAGIVSSLLSKGADPDMTTKSGKTALDLAKTGLMEYPGKKGAYDQVISLLDGR